MRFVDFIIFLCALMTAGSTFAIAVHLIVGWDNFVPLILDTLRDWGLQDFLPRGSASAPA